MPNDRLSVAWQVFAQRMLARGYTSKDDLNRAELEELLRFEAEFARRGSQGTLF